MLIFQINFFLLYNIIYYLLFIIYYLLFIIYLLLYNIIVMLRTKQTRKSKRKQTPKRNPTKKQRFLKLFKIKKTSPKYKKFKNKQNKITVKPNRYASSTTKAFFNKRQPFEPIYKTGGPPVNNNKRQSYNSANPTVYKTGGPTVRKHTSPVYASAHNTPPVYASAHNTPRVYASAHNTPPIYASINNNKNNNNNNNKNNNNNNNNNNLRASQQSPNITSEEEDLYDYINSPPSECSVAVKNKCCKQNRESNNLYAKLDKQQNPNPLFYSSVTGK